MVAGVQWFAGFTIGIPIPTVANVPFFRGTRHRQFYRFLVNIEFAESWAELGCTIAIDDRGNFSALKNGIFRKRRSVFLFVSMQVEKNP